MVVLVVVLVIVLNTKMKCQAKTKRGKQCKRPVSFGLFCIYHSNYLIKKREELKKLEGEIKYLKNLKE